LEFTWPAERNQEPRRETWGVRIQFASPTSRAEQTYFCIPARGCAVHEPGMAG